MLSFLWPHGFTGHRVEFAGLRDHFLRRVYS